jgi:hypothetical protein
MLVLLLLLLLLLLEFRALRYYLLPLPGTSRQEQRRLQSCIHPVPLKCLQLQQPPRRGSRCARTQLAVLLAQQQHPTQLAIAEIAFQAMTPQPLKLVATALEKVVFACQKEEKPNRSHRCIFHHPSMPA